MLLELMAIQLFSSALVPNKNTIYCQVNGLDKNSITISTSIDPNGIGYVKKDIDRFSFQVIVAKNKINTLKISDNANDDEKVADMLSTEVAFLSYQDAEGRKKITFSCDIKGVETAHQLAKNDITKL